MQHEYKPWYSFGNVLTLITMVVGAVVITVTFFMQLASAEERIKQTEGRLNRVEHQLSRQIDSVHQDVREIRAALMRMERE